MSRFAKSEVMTLALQALRSTPVFSASPDAVQQGLAGFARVESFAQRTLLCGSQERPDALRYILDGVVQISVVDANGRVSALAPLPRGGWATWLGCFHDAPLSHDLWADAGTRTISFPRARVLASAEQHPVIYRGAIQEIGVRMRALMTWSLQFDQQDDVRALGRYIIAACRAVSGTRDGPHVLPLTHGRLGELGFGSRQRAGRLLQALVEKSLVKSRYGRIEVPSLRRIEKFVRDWDALKPSGTASSQ